MRVQHFYRGLASMLRSGVLIPAAADELARNGTIPLSLANAIHQRVGSGERLAAVLADHPADFPPQDVALIEVGASAGLCLHPDRYAYSYDGRTVGDSALHIPVDCRGAVPVRAQDRGAVRRPHQPADRKPAAMLHRVHGQRHLAAAFERGRNGPFGTGPQRRVGVAQRFQQIPHGGVAFPVLDADRALCRGRQPARGFQGLGDVALQAEPLQAGAGQDDRVVLAVFQLSYPGIHVAAKVSEFQVRAQRAELALAAQTAGSDPGSFGQVIQAPAFAVLHTSERFWKASHVDGTTMPSQRSR